MKITSRIQKAINLAAEKHKGQMRKSNNVPYISHPFAVMVILSRYTDDEDVFIAGLLHDVLEDVKNYRFDDLRNDFGERVAGIVKEVSEDKDPNIKTNKKATWKKRKDGYLSHLKKATREAMLVCAADKIHNLKSITEEYREHGDSLWKHFNASANEELWFYKGVLKILRKGLSDSAIVAELEEAYRETERALGLGDKPFIGFIMNKKDHMFYVYLINPSDINYTRIVELTGAYCGDMDGLLESNKIVKEFEELHPKSSLLIDKSDWGELDFVIWYDLDLYRKGSTEENERVLFQLPKYGMGYDSKIENLPIIRKKGLRINLDDRNDNESIEKKVKHMNMEGGYREFS